MDSLNYEAQGHSDEAQGMAKAAERYQYSAEK